MDFSSFNKFVCKETIRMVTVGLASCTGPTGCLLARPNSSEVSPVSGLTGRYGKVQFRVLHFGLGIAMRVFMKITKVDAFVYTAPHMARNVMGHSEHDDCPITRDSVANQAASLLTHGITDHDQTIMGEPHWLSNYAVELVPLSCLFHCNLTLEGNCWCTTSPQVISLHVPRVLHDLLRPWICPGALSSSRRWRTHPSDLFVSVNAADWGGGTNPLRATRAK